MDKTCYLVISPEGSGSYMLAEAFVSSGCKYIQDGDAITGNKLVVRRSFPHSGSWPDVRRLTNKLVDSGYKVEPIFILRNPPYNTLSVMRRDPDRDTEKEVRNSIFALLEMLHFGSKHSYKCVQYELFVDNRYARKKLFEQLGLPEPAMEFYNGNLKYD